MFYFLQKYTFYLKNNVVYYKKVYFVEKFIVLYQEEMKTRKICVLGRLLLFLHHGNRSYNSTDKGNACP